MLNLLISYTPYMIIGTILVLCMLVASIAAIILVLMQPSNSDGIQAIQGSSETFFGKNKGKSIEEKMKKWTYIALGVLALFSILFFVLGALFTL
ncbi:MAG: preprotein translocase subunit SecG [Clostridia bacterium]|nr:preprotein translocase subunit SecG [Clostridia bacterium]